MARPPRFSRLNERRIADLYRTRSAREVAAVLGCSQTVILRVVRRLGVVRSLADGQTLRRRQRTVARMQRLAEILAAGGSRSDAARELEVSWMTVDRWCKVLQRGAA